MSNEEVTSNQVLEWCQNFLSGTWSTTTAEQMQITSLSGSFTNYLYCCSLSDDVETFNNEPRKVLLRVYGQAHRQHRSTLLIDSIVCTLLSERKLGPQVYGIFPDGRLEEFVEGDILSASEIRDENISQILARMLGEMHQFHMPLVKKPVWLFKTIAHYVSDLPTDVNKFQNERDREIYEELRSVCNFAEEFEQLKAILSTIDSPVCFSHNNFHAENILRLKSQPDKFTIIDFAYCSYNYRGYDIGAHFCEYMFDYQSVNVWPYFHVDFTLYPNENQQINFLTSYVDVLLANDDQFIPTNREITDNNGIDSHRKVLVRKLMREANYYALASYFFGTLWGIHMARLTTMKFGYMEYARACLTAYYLQRTMLTDVDGSMPPQFTEELLQSSKNPFYQSSLTNS